MVLVDALLPKGNQVTFHQDPSSIQEYVTGDLNEVPFKSCISFSYNEEEEYFYSFDDRHQVEKDASRCQRLGSRFKLWKKKDTSFVRASLQFYCTSDISKPLLIVPDLDPKWRAVVKGDFAVASVDTINKKSQTRIFYILVNDRATGERYGQILGKQLLHIDGLTKPTPRHESNLHLQTHC